MVKVQLQVVLQPCRGSVFVWWFLLDLVQLRAVLALLFVFIKLEVAKTLILRGVFGFLLILKAQWCRLEESNPRPSHYK